MNPQNLSILDKIIKFCLLNKLVVFILVAFVMTWGILVAPFNWDLKDLPRDPVPVDAIPDIGENQQIIFTKWDGRSPQDVEDQVTYPLTTALLGLPKVKTVRSFSFFGFSSIYVIFEDDAEFYWSRSRVLEKLNSLPQSTLPQGVSPTLGPDATALGQVYWYTLEGRDPQGNAIGGWDLQELRSIQDWQVRYALSTATGIAEVASIGGYVKEYQVDVDPDAMRSYGISLQEVFNAIRMSNIDIGAKTIEVNKVEYFIRGLGFIKSVEDIKKIVIKENNNVPIYVHNVANVSLGPAMRRGAIDKAGTQAVGGVAVVRYGFNPLQAIKNVKAAIKQMESGLPKKPIIDYNKISKQKVIDFANNNNFKAYQSAVLNNDAWLAYLSAHPDRWPDWITTSQVTVVPFYDRTTLINETLGTLNTALVEEILVTIIVVMMMLMHLRSSILISSLLPLAVLICFILMKLFHVDANVVALSGIAIAIGTMVDMGVVICENIIKHLHESDEKESRVQIIFEATSEVASAVVTAVATTVVSFLPVFAMQAAEGKLFKPLAYTKTFALLGSVIVALIVIPPVAHLLFTSHKTSKRGYRFYLNFLVLIASIVTAFYNMLLLAAGLFIVAVYNIFKTKLPNKWQSFIVKASNVIAALIVATILAQHWAPLGFDQTTRNIIFVITLIGGLLAIIAFFQFLYEPILRFCLAFKYLFLPIPLIIVMLGYNIWQDMGEEFMPDLDEGSYLLMPTIMPHASIGEALDVIKKQDIAISMIPEVLTVVGKIGRVESPLDPAPISMIETIITYKPEYIQDENGNNLRFKYDDDANKFTRDENNKLVPSEKGRSFRQWRKKIKNADDIWKEILNASKVVGTTSAPKLQPIAARIVMLQSGMRAPMGLKIYGPSLKAVESTAIQIEKLLKNVPEINAQTVTADRVVGKPYIEIDINRDAIARHGLHIKTVQDVIEVAIGGKTVTTTVEGRERYPVKIRYYRELRDQIESLDTILVPTKSGAQIPLKQLATINYLQGPQAIKSEDTRLVAYVVFDKTKDYSEVQVVDAATKYLNDKVADGTLIIPDGVERKFAGNYENQLRAKKRLTIVLPLALLLIFLILYFQFKSTLTSILVFSGVFVAW